MNLHALKPGDEVAVMPAAANAPTEVLAIRKVTYVGLVFVRLDNESLFATIGGTGLNSRQRLETPTEEHREALSRSPVAPAVELISRPPRSMHRKHPGRVPGRRSRPR